MGDHHTIEEKNIVSLILDLSTRASYSPHPTIKSVSLLNCFVMLRSHKPYNPTCHASDTIGKPSMSK